MRMINKQERQHNFSCRLDFELRFFFYLLQLLEDVDNDFLWHSWCFGAVNCQLALLNWDKQDFTGNRKYQRPGMELIEYLENGLAEICGR